jgi:hypothetical protein
VLAAVWAWLSNAQRLRWLLALAVGVFALYFFLNGLQDQIVCHDEQFGDDGETVEVCGPPGLTQLLPFMVVIALLLAPDLSDLEITGLVKMRRYIKEQGKAIARIEDEVRQAQPTQPYPPDMRAAAESVERKEQEVLTRAREDPQYKALEEFIRRASQRTAYKVMRESLGEGPIEIDPDSTDREKLIGDLAYLWKNIAQYEASARIHRMTGDRMAHLDEERQEAVDRWADLFEDEIAAVRSMWMRVVVDDNTVTIENLQDAVRTGRELLRILQGGLNLSTWQRKI